MHMGNIMTRALGSSVQEPLLYRSAPIDASVGASQYGLERQQDGLEVSM
jgi:hypothetical protein